FDERRTLNNQLLTVERHAGRGEYTHESDDSCTYRGSKEFAGVPPDSGSEKTDHEQCNHSDDDALDN
ncbi:hypothetical protein, partial [Pseudomonas juntendi]|uniref:hypothetical protein n=1 Tax=Pseudomonas juntendi TaxID=2666183 RepID=UPI001E5ACC6E